MAIEALYNGLRAANNGTDIVEAEAYDIDGAPITSGTLTFEIPALDMVVEGVHLGEGVWDFTIPAIELHQVAFHYVFKWNGAQIEFAHPIWFE